MQLQWAEKAESILKLGRRPQFHDLTKFVQDKADVATNMFGKHIVELRRKSAKDSFKLANNERARATTLVATRNESLPRNEKTASQRCLLCSRGHDLDKCKEFKKNTYGELFSRIKSAIIVLNWDTLQEGASKESIVNCQNVLGKHHTLLHPLQPERENPVQKNKSVQVDLKSLRDCNVASTKRSNVYLRIVPVKVVGTDSRTVKTHALLDSSSDVSLCDKRLISELGLVGVKKNFR